jgi:sulfate permease, SulP family
MRASVGATAVCQFSDLTPLFIPKLFTTLHGYDRKAFSRDLGAGVIVGVVALPLAIAFAIASGVTPEKGLITAVVAGFIISALGGSKVQIGGPTGAFVIIVYGIVQKYGMDGLIITTFLAGIVLVVMGFAKLGTAIKFIPAPVIIGFTSGIAVIIFSSEIPDFFGITIANPPAHFWSKWALYLSGMPSANWWALGVAVITMLIILLWPKINKTIPSPFVALVAATAGVWLLHLPVETIGSRFGAIPSMLPHPHVPHVTFAAIKELTPSIFTVAILAAVESLLSAVVADGMIGSKHRSNMELVAQGAANMASAAFGGMPATGAIARTATNVRSGGRTPVAGIIHALTLLAIMVLLGNLAALIPLAALAAILVVVAYNMSEWHAFVEVFRAPKSDIAVLLTTFLLTVLVDLTVAVEVGMVLAAFLFMHRMAQVTNVKPFTSELEDENEHQSKYALPEGVMIFDVSGALFFGAAEQFAETINALQAFPKVLILRMADVLAIDASGLKVLKDLHHRAIKHDAQLLLTELHAQPLVACDRAGLLTRIGEENVFATVQEAIGKAETLVHS